MKKQNLINYILENELKIGELKILKFLYTHKSSKKTHIEKIGLNYYQIKLSLSKLTGLGLIKEKDKTYTINKKNIMVTKLFEEIV